MLRKRKEKKTYGTTILMNFCFSNQKITSLFTKLPWPGHSEGTSRSSSQTAICQPVYHTWWKLYSVLFNAERQAGKM